MSVPPLAHNFVRKSERAIRSARLDLQDGDPDSAVNRAYYAMFSVAQAALLSVGVSEDKLPKTHRGLIAAFGQHAVQSGLIDPGLGGVLGRTESLRLKADYTGMEIDANTAGLVVKEAETFVRTVERVFALDLARGATAQPENAQLPPDPIEEQRRQARENWLRLSDQRPEEAQDAGTHRDATPRANQEHRNNEAKPGRDLPEDD